MNNLIEIKNKDGVVVYRGNHNTMQDALEFCAKTSTSLDGAVIKDISLKNSKLDGIILDNATIINSKFEYCSIKKSQLNKANISKSCFYNCMFDESSINHTFFSNTKAERSVFNKCKMFGVKIKFSNFSNAFFKEAFICESNITESDFSYADFTDANLSKSFLKFFGCFAIIFKNTNIDLSMIELSCKFTNMIVDDRYIAQFIYHLTRVSLGGCTEEVRNEVEKIMKGPLADLFMNYRNDLVTAEAYLI